MNIIVITSGRRPQLVRQTLSSLMDNAAHQKSHHITLVGDGRYISFESYVPDVVIHNVIAQGASASRNIGAGSIPKYARHELVMFCDDDCFFVKSWDLVLQEMADLSPRTIFSLYGHPFNVEEEREGKGFAKFPLLISSVAMCMRWTSWDEIGYWDLPGGPGGSEDFAYCARARGLGYDFAVSNPHGCIHTGMFSSNGQKIVGYDELAAQNQKLLDLHGLKDVVFG